MKKILQKANTCPICTETAEISVVSNLKEHISCETCGDFDFYSHTEQNGHIESYPDDFNKLASYLFYNNHKKSDNCLIYKLIGSKYDFENAMSENSYGIHITDDIVENWYPKSFNEKINMFLVKIWEMCQFMGDAVHLTSAQLYSATFVTRFDEDSNLRNNLNEQAFYFLDYLKDNKYIAPVTNNYIKLLPAGLQRLDEFHKNPHNNLKDVFISMAFNEDTKETREAIRKGIIAAEYSPEFLDEIIHNKQIVPEMFRLIRECGFLILEISDPNYGAYYEAGYALGLGKEVIICCSSEVFNREYVTDAEKRYAKYLKPHFDIAQKQILLWNDYADLSNKLTEWIKAIIG